MRRRRPHPLADVERDLDVSPRHRLDLLEEVSADAEGLRGELERRGHPPERARRAALNQVVPAEEALAELEAQHAPRLGRWVRAAGWGDRVERLGIATGAVLAGAAACVALARSGPLGSAPALAWPQVVVVALLAANWTRAAKRLWIDGDLRPEPRRHLWQRQAGLIVAAVALGALGAAWEGYGAYETLAAADFAPSATWAAVRRIIACAAVGLGTAIFGLFGWLAITPRLINDEMIERRIAAFFAASRPPPTPSRRR